MGFDPGNGFYLKDDFIGELVTTGNISSTGWGFAVIGNASTLSFVTGTTDAHGVLRCTTAATADGDGTAIHTTDDGLLLNNKGGFVRFKARYPDITGNQLAGNNFRIGVDNSVTATSPTIGIWVDSDAGVLSLQVDSAGHGDLSASAAGVSTLTSGTTMVLGTWHEFLVRWGGENAQGGPKDVQMYVDGELAATSLCNIDDDEPVEPKIAHWQDSGGAASLELDIDYYELFVGK